MWATSQETIKNIFWQKNYLHVPYPFLSLRELESKGMSSSNKGKYSTCAKGQPILENVRSRLGNKTNSLTNTGFLSLH